MHKIKHPEINYVCPVALTDIYKKYIASLKAIYSEGEATAITQIIFLHFTGLSRPQLALQEDEHADETATAKLEDSFEQLLRHVPVQYITGNTRFFSLNFLVNKHVLIPRPETEELVQEVLVYLKDIENKKIIDIGTGSGCIAVSIKKNAPASEVMAVDISEPALETALANALANQVEVEFRNIDFLEEKNYDPLPVFDVIISNPPYIRENEKEILDRNVVQHEPHLALFVPQNDPLIFYKKIKVFAEKHLEKSGRIFLEVHENLAKQTAAVFPAPQYNTVIKKDISGKERMLIIARCP